MDDIVLQLLNKVEDDYLRAVEEDALSQNGVHLAAFQDRWSRIHEDVHQGIVDGTINDDCRRLYYATAARLEILSDNFIQLNTESHVMTSGLMRDLTLILAGVGKP